MCSSVSAWETRDAGFEASSHVVLTLVQIHPHQNCSVGQGSSQVIGSFDRSLPPAEKPMWTHSV